MLHQQSILLLQFCLIACILEQYNGFNHKIRINVIITGQNGDSKTWVGAETRRRIKLQVGFNTFQG